MKIESKLSNSSLRKYVEIVTKPLLKQSLH